MLTSKILSCYNHLVATSMLYFTIVDPIQELTNYSNNQIASEHQYLTSLVEATQTDSEQDHYEVLGVTKDATKHEIHKAFRTLAKKYHPDKNKDKGAQDEFIKIFKAYETLSDEKKRKEYDERSRSSNHGSFGGWQTDTNMNDFDVNEFFKQYEEQLYKHAQHYGQHDQHQHHHHNHHNQGEHDHLHHQFMFHGVNLDDLFHDIDEDEFHSFGRVFSDHHNNHIHSDLDDTFGDGASFFGTHFPSQIHNTLHQYQYQQGVHSSGKASYSCQTITKQVNGMVMTQTSCG